MGIFSRRPRFDVAELASQVAEQVKAMIPTASAELAPAGVAATAPGTLPAPTGGTVVPGLTMPRTSFGAGMPFGPGVPFAPTWIDRPPTGSKLPEPRVSEYMASVNLQIANSRPIPFSLLRSAADQVDILRKCIEVRKSQMTALDTTIALTPTAIAQVMLDNKLDSPSEAASIARQHFEPEIYRLRTWWEKPDRPNQMDWATWLGEVMEEHLVIDALSVWPRRRYSGDIIGLEVIDGSTIKPLLDHRGSTPVPPDPAYQQVLYGLVRGEFTATSDDPGYTSNQLVYRPRIRRSFSPYGLPDTETALYAADLYLKRMAWIRGEFTEGATPDTWMKPSADMKDVLPPEVLEAYEVAINADLAGDVKARRKLKIPPPGFEPDQMDGFAEKYKPELDEFIVKVLCACYSVMPTEIGFPPGSGIGGKGHQEGEANSSHRKAIRPTAKWLEAVNTDLSRLFLGMPEQLVFQLIGYETEDQESAETVANSIIRRAGETVNGDRARRGLPLFTFREADEPFVVTGSGIVFLNGAMAAQAAAAGAPAAGAGGDATTAPEAVEAPPVVDAPPASATDPRPEADDDPQVGDPVEPGEPIPDGFIAIAGHLRRKPLTAAARAEAAKFLTFTAKRGGRTSRTFAFEHLDPTVGAELNRLASVGDLPAVKALVADLGKARARRVSRATKDRLIADHTSRIGAALSRILPAAVDELVDGWQEREATTKTLTDRQQAARAYLAEKIDHDAADDLDDDLDDFLRDGYSAAWEAAGLDVDDLDDLDDDDDEPAGRPTRLGRLLAAVGEHRHELVAAAVTAAAIALCSHDPHTALAATPDDVARSFVTVELATATTAGTLDATQRQGIRRVRLVSDGGCEFCDDYDGRILDLDDENGMPPLHRGCACDIEPLDD